MDKEQTPKNIQYKFLNPVLIEWDDNSHHTELVFLDLNKQVAYSKDGEEVVGLVINSVIKSIFDSYNKIKSPNLLNVSSIYKEALSLQQKIYEENEELIDGAKRTESGCIRAWSGGPKERNKKELGSTEDGEVH